MLIGNNYKIEADRLNITVYEAVKVKKNDSYRWQPIGYFSNFHNALKFIADLGVKETGLKDFRAVVAKQEEIYSLISSLNGSPEALQRCMRGCK
jgi:hypothetical protein